MGDIRSDHQKVDVSTDTKGNIAVTPDFINSVFTHPNPFTHELAFSWTAASATTYQLTLFDAIGRQVGQQRGEVQKGGNTVQMDNLQDLSPGIYFYKMDIGGETFTGKILKQ